MAKTLKINPNQAVDQYITGFPEPVKSKLSQLRSIIREAAPDAVECISYAMPAYKLKGKPLVYFAGYQNHIGFYATPTGHASFEKDLSKYKQGKGSVQFPVKDMMPWALIRKMVAFRVKEVDGKLSATDKKKKGIRNKEVERYHENLPENDRKICEKLYSEIHSGLPGAENKVWHAHPVWFLEGNPIVGYSKLKDGIRLLFWSGQSFDEPGLQKEGKFKAAEVRYKDISEIRIKDLRRWLKKAAAIQWDYKNIVKRKGVLERLK